MMTLHAEIDDKKVQLSLTALANRGRNLRPVFEDIGENVVKRGVMESIDQQRDPVTGKAWPKRRPVSLLSRRGGGGKMLFDTGRLLRSVAAATPKITNSSAAFTVGAGVPYAAVQNYGATIHAQGGHLAIPLSVEAKRGGTARRFIQQKKSKGEAPFFFRSKRGNLLSAYWKGRKVAKPASTEGGKHHRAKVAKKGKLTLAFLLKKSVVIPQRRFMGFGPTAYKRIEHTFLDHFGEVPGTVVKAGS